MAREKLDLVLGESPKAKELLEKAFGYAVFDNTKLSLGIAGGGGGKGVAVEKASGKRTYMRMQAAGVGLGIGAQTYNVVFLFEDERTFRGFVDKGWTAESSASAVAGDQGAGVGDAFVNGMAGYVLTDKGLMARADITGTKCWKNARLDEN
jgi:lipid-binding SYLF domain-containing protein